MPLHCFSILFLLGPRFNAEKKCCLGICTMEAIRMMVQNGPWDKCYCPLVGVDGKVIASMPYGWLNSIFMDRKLKRKSYLENMLSY